jgi:hypothetical protein
MSTPEPTADFYPTGAVIPFSATMAARALGHEGALLTMDVLGRIRLGGTERVNRIAALIRAGDTLIAARCGSVVYDFMEGLMLGFEADNAAARDLRAAIPAAWHKLYSDNAAHIAASRGYRG